MRGCLPVPSRTCSGLGAAATATQSKRKGTPMPQVEMLPSEVQGALQAANKAPQHQEESGLYHQDHGTEDMWIASVSEHRSQCYPVGFRGWSTSQHGAAP